MSIQVMIADDHGLVRGGLRALLSAEPEIEVVAETSSGDETLKQATALKPDILLLDISMPGPSGIDVTRSLKETSPQTQILIATVHEDESLLQEAIDAGAAGYIVKKAVESELIDAIRAVHRGDMYIHPAMTRALLNKDNGPRENRSNTPVEALTPREVDVLRLIAQGYTNRQMAEKMSISIRTVEGYRANLMGKLGLQGRVELVSYARKNNLAP
jgi:two-component system response regulator NreC